MCDELFQGMLQSHPTLRTLDLVGGVCPVIPPACMGLGIYHKGTMQTSNVTPVRSTQESQGTPGTCTTPSSLVAPYSPSSPTRAQGSWNSAVQFGDYLFLTLNT